MEAAIVLAQAAGQGGFDKFVNTLGSALALGAIYAILALGFVIIFKATQVVNFAHGAIAAFGAYMVVYFATVLNIPGKWFEFLPYTIQWSLSAVLAILATALLGIVVERVAIRPMIGEPLFAVAIITLGLDLIIRTVTIDFMGNQARGLGDPGGANVLEWGSLRIATNEVVTITMAVLAMLLLAWFFRKMRWRKASTWVECSPLPEPSGRHSPPSEASSPRSSRVGRQASRPSPHSSSSRRFRPSSSAVSTRSSGRSWVASSWVSPRYSPRATSVGWAGSGPGSRGSCHGC
jgi:hypothetical protein